LHILYVISVLKLTGILCTKIKNLLDSIQ